MEYKMSRTGVKIGFITLMSVLFLSDLATGSYPKAQNVSWSSINFKTLLTWSPKPSDYSYTVEFSIQGQNRERSPHCIQAMETECDLSNFLTDLKAKYSADVLSEPLRGATSDLVEFPHTRSLPFCPYKDTQIGRPDFRIEVGKDKKKITLHVQDPVTALFNKDNRPMTIRDVFADDLQYKVTYRKAHSTGKKTQTSRSSAIELEVDRGESYCFQVQAYLPARSPEHELGELSHLQCSHDDDKGLFEEYGIGVIAGGVLLIIAVVAGAIAGAVLCCRRRGRANHKEKEGVV